MAEKVPGPGSRAVLRAGRAAEIQSRACHRGQAGLSPLTIIEPLSLSWPRGRCRETDTWVQQIETQSLHLCLKLSLREMHWAPAGEGCLGAPREGRVTNWGWSMGRMLSHPLPPPGLPGLPTALIQPPTPGFATLARLPAAPLRAPDHGLRPLFCPLFPLPSLCSFGLLSSQARAILLPMPRRLFSHPSQPLLPAKSSQMANVR